MEYTNEEAKHIKDDLDVDFKQYFYNNKKHINLFFQELTKLEDISKGLNNHKIVFMWEFDEEILTKKIYELTSGNFKHFSIVLFLNSDPNKLFLENGNKFDIDSLYFTVFSMPGTKTANFHFCWGI